MVNREAFVWQGNGYERIMTSKGATFGILALICLFERVYCIVGGRCYQVYFRNSRFISFLNPQFVLYFKNISP